MNPIHWLTSGFAKSSLNALFLHPLRSLLTILGVAIGVASVIWLQAIGEGIGRAVQKQIEGLGADNIIVRSIKPPAEETAGRRGIFPYGITRDDLARITETLPSIQRAIPIREVRREFRFADRLVDGRMVGCTPAYADLTKLEVDRGRFLSPADSSERQNVCVLAAETVLGAARDRGSARGVDELADLLLKDPEGQHAGGLEVVLTGDVDVLRPLRLE